MIGLFFPNRAQPGLSVSGGSWLAGLPASNVCTLALAEVARSATDAEADTKVTVDLGQARVMRAFAVVNHNLSGSATWRVLLGTTAGASDVYASSWATWLLGTFESAAAALGMEDGVYLREGLHAIHVAPSFKTARYVTFEFSDTSNPDGYVQIGRVFAGGGVITTYNAEYGLQDSWVDLSTKEESESGASWITARRRLKQVSFVLEALSLEEAELLHEMQRVLGTIGETLYVPDIRDMATSQRYGFLGELRELGAIEYPYFRMRRLPLSIKQKG